MIIELNIGLDVRGEANSTRQLAERAVAAIGALRKAFGPLALQATRRFESQYENDNGVLVLESAVYARLNSPLGWGPQYDALYALAETLQQDCIAAYYPALGKGELIGPGAAAWPDFDLDYFTSFEGENLERKAA